MRSLILGKVWRSVCSCVPQFAERFLYDDADNKCIRRLKDLISALRYNGRFAYGAHLAQNGLGKKSLELSFFRCLKVNLKSMEERLIDYALKSYHQHPNDIGHAKSAFDRLVQQYIEERVNVGFVDIPEEIRVKQTVINRLAAFVGNFVFSIEDYGNENRQIPFDLPVFNASQVVPTFFFGVSSVRQDQNAQEEAEPGLLQPS